MSGRKAVIGLCVMCALLVSAVASQAASAASTTAFTCVEGTGGGLNSTCETATGGNFKHVAIPANTTTELSGKNNGVTFLKGTTGGLELKLEAKKLSGTGTMTNSEVSGEMLTSGTGVITYEEVAVVAPAGKGCEVEGKKVVTNSLKASTAGLTKELKFSPASGTVFAAFVVKGCSVAAFNREYKAEGTVNGKLKGSMTEFTHTATTASPSALTLNGQKAGLEGVLELSARANSSQAFSPLSVT
jgi:hypothetical protein